MPEGDTIFRSARTLNQALVAPSSQDLRQPERRSPESTMTLLSPGAQPLQELLGLLLILLIVFILFAKQPAPESVLLLLLRLRLRLCVLLLHGIGVAGR
jgi:hypothetical protein